MSVVVNQLNRAVPQVALEATTTARRFRYTSLFALPGNQNTVNGLFSPFTALSDCGWWGDTLSNANGYLPTPATLYVTKRISAYSFNLVGIQDNYPVDFTLLLYLEGEEVEQVVVTGNTEPNRSIVLSHAYDIDAYRLTVTRISKGNDVLKISTASFDVNASNLMKSYERRIRGRIEVTYLNALRDSAVEANSGAYASSGMHLSNGITSASAKFFKLYNNMLDGTFKVIGPNSETGWWPKAIPDAEGRYASPQTLQLRFSTRNIYGFSIYSDTTSFPVDFTVSIVSHGSTSTIATVENYMSSTYHVYDTLLDVDGINITVTRTSRAGFPAVIMEVPLVTSVVYEADKLIDMTMLEELTYEDSLEKLGGVSANELTVTFSNEDHSFDFNNTNSRVAGYLKKNRRIRAWLGVDIPGTPLETDSTAALRSIVSVYHTDGTVDISGKILPKVDSTCCASLPLPIVLVDYTNGIAELDLKDSASLSVQYVTGNMRLGGDVMAFVDDSCCATLTQPLAVSDYRAGTVELDLLALPGNPAMSSNTLWSTLGTFWTHEWTVPARGLSAKTVAFDTIGLLGTETYYDHVVYRNKSIGWLVDNLFESAKKRLSFIEWSVEPVLYDIIIPVAWFKYASYTAALNRIASCDFINIFCDRDGRVLVKRRLNALQSPDDVWSEDTNVIDTTYPTLNTAPANYIDVKVTRVITSSQSVLDITNISDIVAAGEVRLFNFSSPVDTVSSVTISTNATYSYVAYSWGLQVTFQSSGTLSGISVTGSALAVDTPTSVHMQNDSAIEDDGIISCEITSDFIQTSTHAHSIAEYLYSNLARSIYDADVTYRGDAAITLNSKISLPEGLAPNNLYFIKRHELYWNGALRGTATLST